MRQLKVSQTNAKNIKNTQNKQQGFALMGLMIAIAIIGLILSTYYWRQVQTNKVKEAQILGNQLAQYVSAVQARMSGDDTFRVGSYSDLLFLKSNSCTGNAGTAPENYLPCHFNFKRFSNDLMENDPVTHITDMTSDKRTAIITVDKITARDGNTLAVSPYLGSVVSQSAQAHFGADQHAVYNGAAVYHYDNKTGVITIDVNVQGTNSKWLCVDGCNKMQANLKFDTSKSVNEREIQDVSNIRLNNANAEIKGNGNVTLLATNQAYIGGETAKLIGSSQAVMATGTQQITIDPSRIVVDSSAFDNNATTINLNSTTTNINRNKGTAYIGNQSGTQGNSNVVVNDLTIHSMRDQKLTTLLKNKSKYYEGFRNNAGSLSFSVTTGDTGYAMITAYGGRRATYASYANYYLTLLRNGTKLREVYLTGIEYQDRRSSVSPSFMYSFHGAPNTTYSGFTVQITGNGTPTYIGWAYFPF